MDKKLLDALNNLSESLDLIAQVLSEKDGAQSPTAKALESGDFVNQIKEINEGVKKIQADNQKIIKNQETILALSKKKETEKKTGAFQTAGDKDMQKLIKTGVSIVLIIAAGVLAIGMAFKLVGKIDFLSVVGLSLAMVLVAVAFEKIAKLNLSRKEALNTSLVMVIMSAGLTASSWILSLIRPIGFNQVVTGTLIGIMFAAMSSSLENIFVATILFDKLKVSPVKLLISLVSISASITASSWVLSLIKPINFGQAMTAILTAVMLSVISYNLHKIGAAVVAFEKTGVKPLSLVKVLLGIATAITASSWILSMTKPISFGQAITAILIAAMFAVVSFNLEKIAAGVIAFEKTKVKATSLLMVLVGIATAITASSWILSMTKPISLPQALTIILIAVIFASMSYIMPELAIGIMIIDKYVGKSKIWLVPLMFITISIAIMASSWVLSKTTPVPFMTLLNILVMSVVLSIAAVVIGITAFVLDKIGPSKIISGSLSILIIAGVISLSSHILSMGDYKNYPDWKWALGVGLSIITFSLPIVALGIIAMSGVGALAILAGAAMVLLVAGTIVATSYILSAGTYNKYPTNEWASGAGLSMTTFGLATLGLGIFILGTLGIGWLALEAGSAAVLLIANTIVQSASILGKGNFSGGPKKEWSEGVSLAIGAFAPVYGMLMANSIMSIFGMGVSPDDFVSAIRTISSGIVEAAISLGKSPGIWKNGPSKEWAEGVGTAIGAFAPVYKILSESKGWFSKGPSVDEMRNSIMTISQGIVDAANFFGQNTAAFDLSKIPTKEWGENVGSAIGAFIPALNFISENSGIFSSGTDALLEGISAVGTGIVNVAKKLSEGVYNTSIPAGWIDSISGNIKAYINLSKYVSENYSTGGIMGKISSAFLGSSNPIDGVVYGMIKLSSAYNLLSKSISNFGKSINGIDAEKLATIRSFTSNVILMSIMDPSSFEDMLNKLEEKAGVFTEIISDMNSAAEQGNKKSATGVKTGTTTTSKTDQTQQQMLQILSAMDAKLGTIARNSSTLADYTNELRTGQGVKIKK